MIDTEPIVRLATELARDVEQIETEDFSPFVRQVMIVLELDMGDRMRMITGSSDDRKWVQIAFLDHAANYLELNSFSTVSDD